MRHPALRVCSGPSSDQEAGQMVLRHAPSQTRVTSGCTGIRAYRPKNSDSDATDRSSRQAPPPTAPHVDHLKPDTPIAPRIVWAWIIRTGSRPGRPGCGTSYPRSYEKFPGRPDSRPQRRPPRDLPSSTSPVHRSRHPTAHHSGGEPHATRNPCHPPPTPRWAGGHVATRRDPGRSRIPAARHP